MPSSPSVNLNKQSLSLWNECVDFFHRNVICDAFEHIFHRSQGIPVCLVHPYPQWLPPSLPPPRTLLTRSVLLRRNPLLPIPNRDIGPSILGSTFPPFLRNRKRIRPHFPSVQTYFLPPSNRSSANRSCCRYDSEAPAGGRNAFHLRQTGG